MLVSVPAASVITLTQGLETGWGPVTSGRLGKNGRQHDLSDCKSLLVSLGLGDHVDVLKLLICLGVSGGTTPEYPDVERVGSNAGEDVEVAQRFEFLLDVVGLRLEGHLVGWDVQLEE